MIIGLGIASFKAELITFLTSLEHALMIVSIEEFAVEASLLVLHRIRAKDIQLDSLNTRASHVGDANSRLAFYNRVSSASRHT